MQPFFSFIIPTCNRPQNLKQAIKSILNQQFKDYEIIITDNSSNFLSQKICKDYKDKRIRYYKNKNNIGFVKNLYKNINLAKGRYLFILGDDDLLLEQTLLNNIYRKITKHHYGYLRIKFVYHKQFKKLFSLYFNKKLEKQERILAPHTKDLKIYHFLEKSIYTFISGIVFLNTHNFVLKEIESNKKEAIDLSNFWIMYLFNAAKLYGGYIDTDDTILAQWPEYTNPTFYNVIDNKIPEERIWALYDEIVDKKTMDEIKKEYVCAITKNLPSIKYYSNIKNVILFSKRLIEIDPQIRFRVSFYCFLLAAIIIPKKLWSVIRANYQKSQQVTNQKTKRDFITLLQSF